MTPPSRERDGRAGMTTVDILKSAALIGTFVVFLTIFAMWVLLWENVWQSLSRACSWCNLRHST